jgi:hypothetical protein
MSNYDSQQGNGLRENIIKVGVGFVANERSHLVEILSTLGPHLGKWDPSNIDLEVSLHDRGGKEQRVTLRTILPGRSPLIAIAENPDIDCALSEVKRELIRQLEHQKSMREPMNNRRLRNATIRQPGGSASPQGVDPASRQSEAR